MVDHAVSTELLATLVSAAHGPSHHHRRHATWDQNGAPCRRCLLLDEARALIDYPCQSCVECHDALYEDINARIADIVRDAATTDALRSTSYHFVPRHYLDENGDEQSTYLEVAWDCRICGRITVPVAPHTKIAALIARHTRTHLSSVEATERISICCCGHPDTAHGPKCERCPCPGHWWWRDHLFAMTDY